MDSSRHNWIETSPKFFLREYNGGRIPRIIGKKTTFTYKYREAVKANEFAARSNTNWGEKSIYLKMNCNHFWKTKISLQNYLVKQATLEMNLPITAWTIINRASRMTKILKMLSMRTKKVQVIIFQWKYLKYLLLDFICDV